MNTITTVTANGKNVPCKETENGFYVDLSSLGVLKPSEGISIEFKKEPIP